MIATYINAVSIILGALLGLLIRGRLSEKFKEVVFSVAGLVTLTIGISMAMETGSYLVLLFSLVAGGFLGYMIGIEDAILNLGTWIEKRTVRASVPAENGNGTNFAKGFLNSSVLFCSGSMAVVGSISAGTVGDYNLILIKSVMDGAMAIIFSAAYGPGVIGSAVSVLIYQGIFTIGGSALAPLMKETGLNELSAAGGVLLVMIAFNLIGVKQFKTGNFLPALILAPFFSYLGILLSQALPFL